MLIIRRHLVAILAQLLVALFLCTFVGTQGVFAQTPLPTCTELITTYTDSDNVNQDVDIDKNNNGLIEICDLEGLHEIRDNRRGRGTTQQGCPSNGCNGFELTRDLDFMDINSYRMASSSPTYTVADYDDSSDVGWQPIGNFDRSFRARFNGNGHTISNLMINRSTEYVGLFGSTFSNGQITNLGLLNVKIRGGGRTGGLAGWNQGIITNSHATGKVEGSGNNIGGLVGWNQGTITNSHATGKVEGSGDNVGGLVGDNGGTITNSYATSTVTAVSVVGGLVGDNPGTIERSYATGTVEGSNNIVGGLAGWNQGTITNSYATGTVSGPSNVAGLVGSNQGGASITNSYATGGVGSNVSGLVADNGVLVNFVDPNTPLGIITNSYAIGNLPPSGIGDDTPGAPAEVKKTAEELKSPIEPGSTTVPTTATYYTWDPDIWDFGTSDQFPALKYSIGTDTNNPQCSDTPPQTGSNQPQCGTLFPNQGMNIVNSSLREGFREITIGRVFSDPLMPPLGVSTNNYTVTIFSPNAEDRDITLRFKVYNPDAEIQIFKDTDFTTDYFADKRSGEESLPVRVGPDTKLTIRFNEPYIDYTLSFAIEDGQLPGIRIRAKVFLEGALQ